MMGRGRGRGLHSEALGGHVCVLGGSPDRNRPTLPRVAPQGLSGSSLHVGPSS